MKKIAFILGSDSDYPVIEKALEICSWFEVAYDLEVLSAHRTPSELEDYLVTSEKEGLKIIIAVAGKAAHLPGVIASKTSLPVIGVPVKSSMLGGLDALLSMSQMPSGVPVATMGTNGAENALLFAMRILAISSPQIAKKYKEYVGSMREDVLEKNRKLKERVRG